ncbi:MAG TPA: CPBP family intramembrane glutamic endopeptidase [Blastocatellia bacterium]|jgi:membrane protease YdiL (CAAX protease family)
MTQPDAIKWLFINDEGELRSGWRVLAFIVIFILASFFITALVVAVGRFVPEFGRYLERPVGSEAATSHLLINSSLDRLIALAAAIISTAIAARTLERRSFASAGFKLHRGWLKDFALGSVWGAATLAFAVLIAAGAGATFFRDQQTSPEGVAGGFFFLFFFFLVAGAFEELMFRGFIFQALAHNLGPVAAIALTSIPFGLVHLSNPSAASFSTINTILAGVWLGIAYLLTRSLWLATALHYSWNFAIVFIFGLPVSGINDFERLAMLDGEPAPPDWLSGGSYGPEGGAAVTLALIVSTLLLWKAGIFKPSTEMLEAIKHGPPDLPRASQPGEEIVSPRPREP